MTLPFVLLLRGDFPFDSRKLPMTLYFGVTLEGSLGDGAYIDSNQFTPAT